MYYKSWPASSLLLLNDRNEVLLAVRGFEPDKGMFDLPGGFCDYAEHFEDAFRREVKEETGITPDAYGQPEYLTCGIDFYVYEGEEEPALNLVYWARLIKEVDAKPADDITDVVWVPLAKVDLNKFSTGFETGKKAIQMLQEKLR